MRHSDYLSLVNKAQKWSHEYYVLSAPSVSDAEFDTCIAQIEVAEQEHPEWITPDSPTQHVGSDLSKQGRRLITHRTAMLSCQKAKSLAQLQAWVAKTDERQTALCGDDEYSGTYNYGVMWKYDGISCSLVYQDGHLISAATRGDGKQGQDILAHVLLMDSVPQHLCHDIYPEWSLAGRIEVRGEIICPRAALSLMAQKYTDCRTAASSLCNQAMPSADVKLLEFRPWDADVDAEIAADIRLSPTPLDYPWHMMGFLKHVGFLESTVQNCHGYDSIATLVAKRDAERKDLDFPVDGIVIRVCSRNTFLALGATEHHPHGSVAYKFDAEKTYSRCTRIEMKVGATGRVTPVVHFKPVVLLGRTIRKASVGSERKLQELGIVIGSAIEVGLSNDVRPTIYRVIDGSEITESSQTPAIDPLAGVDFPGEPTPTNDLFSSVEEPEAEWLAPSFADIVSPDAENEAQDEDLSAGGEDNTPHPQDEEQQAENTPARVGSSILSTIGIILIGISVVAMAIFGLPLLHNSLKA